jgi:uncharacterized membrane protein
VTEPEEHEQDPSVLMKVVTRNVFLLRQIIRRFIIVFSIVVVLLVAGGVTLGIILNQQHNDQVATCQAGNVFRANDKLRWDDFIGLLVGGNSHPSATALAEAHKYLALVAMTDAQRHC